MTPEQKAKEIVEKHYCIIEDATAGLFEEDVEYVKARQTAAKACAIEEVKAVIAVTPKKKGWSKETLLLMEANMDNPKDFEEPDSDELKYWEQVLTELENL